MTSRPYPFPLKGTFSPRDTLFLFIDFQGDFCRPDGFMGILGLDVGALSAPLPNAARLLAAARAAGFRVAHTREGYAPDLSDAPPNRLWKGNTGDEAAVGDEGPLGRHLIRGEEGWNIMAEVAPLEGEPVFDKPSYGAFATTDIGAYMERESIRNIVACGVTSDCCVHQTVQEALDRSYDCLTVSDASAAGFLAVHDRMMEQIVRKGGVFGAVATTEEVVGLLRLNGSA